MWDDDENVRYDDEFSRESECVQTTEPDLSGILFEILRTKTNGAKLCCSTNTKGKTVVRLTILTVNDPTSFSHVRRPCL
ncbi:hypothetical protein Ae201684P_013869 [Aphanomyces euteiches]|nr:hypothetical protein Ae201684P_013869 [Aphanomyces euteiches]